MLYTHVYTFLNVVIFDLYMYPTNAPLTSDSLSTAQIICDNLTKYAGNAYSADNKTVAGAHGLFV